MNLHALTPTIANCISESGPEKATRHLCAERLLVPVDGSFASNCAIAHAIDVASRNRFTEIRILNVQPPIMVGDVSPMTSVQVVSAWRARAGEEALRDATVLLDANRIEYTADVILGDPAQTIVDFAERHQCTSIVMGTRGRSAIASLVLGSVAARVIRLAGVPVTLVKQTQRRAELSSARHPRDLFDSANDCTAAVDPALTGGGYS